MSGKSKRYSVEDISEAFEKGKQWDQYIRLQSPVDPEHEDNVKVLQIRLEEAESDRDRAEAKNEKLQKREDIKNQIDMWPTWKIKGFDSYTIKKGSILDRLIKAEEKNEAYIKFVKELEEELTQHKARHIFGKGNHHLKQVARDGLIAMVETRTATIKKKGLENQKLKEKIRELEKEKIIFKNQNIVWEGLYQKLKDEVERLQHLPKPFPKDAEGGGWIVCPNYLQEIKFILDEKDQYLEWEDIEAVLLAQKALNPQPAEKNSQP